ncbi:helix-turn-helix domain-containing protein [Candidatus Binatia bacterium]|nr:helix-turn-helix domain-containing protein [Candidatus Binatia bacterium]
MSGRLFRADWSDADLAGRAGLSRLRVNRIKNRRIRPTVRDALLISRALGVPVGALFRLADSERP